MSCVCRVAQNSPSGGDRRRGGVGWRCITAQVGIQTGSDAHTTTQHSDPFSLEDNFLTKFTYIIHVDHCMTAPCMLVCVRDILQDMNDVKFL